MSFHQSVRKYSKRYQFVVRFPLGRGFPAASVTGNQKHEATALAHINRLTRSSQYADHRFATTFSVFVASGAGTGTLACSNIQASMRV